MKTTKTSLTQSFAKALNEGCSCTTLDKNLLRSQAGLEDIMESRPNLFSSTSVFLSTKHFQALTEIILTIEKVIQLPLFQEKALARSPDMAHRDFGTKGVFMGYDFHLDNDGPKLIEINTNAGGALLNLELAKAQELCGRSQEAFLNSTVALSRVETLFFDMFMNEWQGQKGNEPMGLVAIVDVDPKNQYLYPEFQLFQRLFSKYKVPCVIVDPSELTWRAEKLWHGDQKVDLVYNRLTDFYLEEEAHGAIRSAYESGATVVTPSPHHHALYGHKLNLVTLSSQLELESLGVSAANQEILLSGIPKTIEVKDAELWAERKNYFFKPVAGFGSKATYRGDKITTKVWQHILQGGYVAQELVSPGQRFVNVDGNPTDLKLDLRAYVYDGMIQIMASRLYSGQTTNFRTAGGGFAPVFVVPN